MTKSVLGYQDKVREGQDCHKTARFQCGARSISQCVQGPASNRLGGVDE